MSGYSKVPRQLFSAPDFRDLPEDSRNLYLYLLVCPHANSFGYFIVSDGYVRDDLQWEPQRLAAAWGPLLQAQLVHRDARTRTVLILRALAENAPENPSVVKGWRSILEALPRSPLLLTLAKQAKLYLKQPWQLEWLPPELAALEEPAEHPVNGAMDTPATGSAQTQPDPDGRANNTVPTLFQQGVSHPVDTVSTPSRQGVPHSVDIPSPSPNPSPNPNPNPCAAAARAGAQGSVPQIVTESKTRPTPATADDLDDTHAAGRVDDIMSTASGQGGGHRVDTVSRPCQQGVAHSADIPNPSPNPSPNPNPNPAAAARAPAQGSNPENITESRTRPTLPTVTEQGDTDPVDGVNDTVPTPSGQGDSHRVNTMPTPCGQGEPHRVETVSTPCGQGVPHSVDIPSPSPNPNPNPSPNAAAARAPAQDSPHQVATESRSPPGTACRCYENIWGFLPSGQHDREMFHELEARYPADWLEAAFKECADSGTTCRNFKYLQRILDRWEIEGFKSSRKEHGNDRFQAIGRGAHRQDRQPIQPIEFQEDGPG